jgi:hypothetical protein
MVTLQGVMMNALWVIGLAGVLATFSYMDWWRQMQGWTWSQAWNMPRLLAPLSWSLAVTSIGVCGSGWMAKPPAAWWITLIWAALALLFMVQAMAYSLAGKRRGWDTPV